MSRIAAITTHYGKLRLRSRAEARWCVFLDCIGIAFQYEFEGFGLSSGGYLPDFWIPAWRCFLEVKGADPTDEEIGRCAELSLRHQSDVLIAIGPPDETYQILRFVAGSDETSDVRWVIARDRVASAGFWLVPDDDGAALRLGGPYMPSDRAYGPMFSGSLEQAYTAAAQEDFIRGSGGARYRAFVDTDPERLDPEAKAEEAA